MAYCYKVKVNNDIIADLFDREFLPLFIDGLLDTGSFNEIKISREGIDVYCPENENYIDNDGNIVREGNADVTQPTTPKGCEGITFNKSHTHLNDGSIVVKLSGGSKPNPDYVPPASVKKPLYEDKIGDENYKDMIGD